MAGTAPTEFHFTRTLDAGPVHCSVWLDLRPLPVGKSSNEIIERTSLVTVFERLNLKLLKHFERLEYPGHDFICQHASEDFSICGRHSFEQQVDLVLLRDEICPGVLIPDAFPRARRSDLALALFARANEVIDDLPIQARLAWFVHGASRCIVEV